MPFGSTGGQTIVATMGMDTDPAVTKLQQLPQHVKRALDQATQHTKTFSSDFSKVFAAEGLGERRGAHALARLSEAMVNLNKEGTNTIATIRSVGLAMSTGLAGGVVIGGVAALAERFVALNEELLKTRESIAKVLAEGNKTGTFQGVTELQEHLKTSTEQAQKLYEQVVQIMHPAAVIGGPLQDIEALLKGYRPKSISGLFGGPESARAQELKELTEDINRLHKEDAATVEKITVAEIAAAAVEETRFRVSQAAADAAAEELRHKETLGRLAATQAAAGVAGTPQAKAENEAENQRHQQALQRIEEQHQAELRAFAAKKEAGEYDRRQAEIRSQLGMPGQREALAAVAVQAAKAEVEAAEKEVAAATTRDEKVQHTAALQLQSAQTRELEAETELRQTAAQESAARREFQAKTVAGQYAQQQAQLQGKIVNIQNSALSTNEKQLAIARERVALAESNVEAAHDEVAAARDQVEISKNLSEEDQRRAALRLQSAQTQETQARTAVRAAAGGVAEERARQLEAAGKEEEMSPQEKAEQQRQRQKQYEGLVRAAARQGIRADLIDTPKYGETEYDPLRRFKAAATQEEVERMSASQGTQCAQQQLEMNKLLAQAGQNPAETPKAGQLGVLLPTDITKLAPAQREKVEAQIPVMRVMGVTGGTPVAVKMEDEPDKDKKDKPQPRPDQPQRAPAPTPQAPPSQEPGAAGGAQGPQAAGPQATGPQAAGPQAGRQMGRFEQAASEQPEPPATIKPPEGLTTKNMMDMTPGGYQLQQTGPDQYIWALKPEASKAERVRKAAMADRYVQQQMGGQYEGVDAAKAAELQQGIEANQAYWQNPQVQEGFQQQAPKMRELPAEEPKHKGFTMRKIPGPEAGSPEAGGVNKQYQPIGGAGSSEPGGIPVSDGEGAKGEGGEGGDWQTLAAKALTSIPPELVGIGGRASPIAAIAQELINPETVQAAPLSPAQQKEAFEKSIGTLKAKGDPESQALMKRLQNDPDYIKAKGADGSAAGFQERPTAGPWKFGEFLDGGGGQQGAMMPPQPQQPQQPQPGGGGGGGLPVGGGEGEGIARAIKDAITSVMDKYWAG